MLQLPLDVWRDILRGLPRGYIDQLIDLDRATHVAINAISEPNKDGPLRTILLEVYARGGKHHHIYVAKCRQNHANPNEEALDIGYRIRCTTSMQLFRAMRDSVVRNAWFNYVDEQICTVLSPHVRRWRNWGRIHRVPRAHQTAALFRRFFQELVFTTGSMTLELPMHLQFPFEPASFWTQEAVRRCPSLKINLHRWVNAPHWALTSEQVVGWLSIHTGNSGKRMELEAPVLARSPGRLIDDLLEHFKRDSAPKVYTVRILTLYARNRRGVHTNNETNEELRVYADAMSMIVERKKL